MQHRRPTELALQYSGELMKAVFTPAFSKFNEDFSHKILIWASFLKDLVLAKPTRPGEPSIPVYPLMKAGEHGRGSGKVRWII